MTFDCRECGQPISADRAALACRAAVREHNLARDLYLAALGTPSQESARDARIASVGHLVAAAEMAADALERRCVLCALRRDTSEVRP